MKMSFLKCLLGLLIKVNYKDPLNTISIYVMRNNILLIWISTYIIFTISLSVNVSH